MLADFDFTESAFTQSLALIIMVLPNTKSPNSFLPEVAFRFIWFTDYNDIYTNNKLTQINKLTSQLW